jgi:RecB family exonuclease
MNLAQGRPRSPSFYALDVLRAITGRVPDLGELQRRSTASIQSLIGWPAPRNAATAIDDAEYDLAVISGLLRLSPAEARGRARYLVGSNPILARSLRARSGRWKAKWSESDGVVPSAAAIREVLASQRFTERPYSATALQHFAACPYRFLLYAIQRLQPREETVAIERIDALTRGSLFHTTQFRLLSELRGLRLLPVTLDNLSGTLGIADRIFDEVAESYREDLAPAIPRVWDSQIEDIRWDLRGWLRQMADPANTGWTPAWFELSFGLPPAREKDPASRPDAVLLPEGLRLRGAIDMIEVSSGMPAERSPQVQPPQPLTLRITDHKTGKAPAQRPGVTGHGEILQPLLYARAAEAVLGKPVASSRLSYCTERGGYQVFDVMVNDFSLRSLAKVVNTIDQAIAEGFLPAAPREGACTWCDYRLVCGPYEETRIRRKPTAELAALEDLRETP